MVRGANGRTDRVICKGSFALKKIDYLFDVDFKVDINCSSSSSNRQFCGKTNLGWLVQSICFGIGSQYYSPHLIGEETRLLDGCLQYIG